MKTTEVIRLDKGFVEFIKDIVAQRKIINPTDNVSLPEITKQILKHASMTKIKTDTILFNFEKSRERRVEEIKKQITLLKKELTELS